MTIMGGNTLQGQLDGDWSAWAVDDEPEETTPTEEPSTGSTTTSDADVTVAEEPGNADDVGTTVETDDGDTAPLAAVDDATPADDVADEPEPETPQGHGMSLLDMLGDPDADTATMSPDDPADNHDDVGHFAFPPADAPADDAADPFDGLHAFEDVIDDRPDTDGKRKRFPVKRIVIGTAVTLALAGLGLGGVTVWSHISSAKAGEACAAGFEQATAASSKWGKLTGSLKDRLAMDRTRLADPTVADDLARLASTRVGRPVDCPTDGDRDALDSATRANQALVSKLDQLDAKTRKTRDRFDASLDEKSLAESKTAFDKALDAAKATLSSSKGKTDDEKTRQTLAKLVDEAGKADMKDATGLDGLAKRLDEATAKVTASVKARESKDRQARERKRREQEEAKRKAEAEAAAEAERLAQEQAAQQQAQQQQQYQYQYTPQYTAPTTPTPQPQQQQQQSTPKQQTTTPKKTTPSTPTGSDGAIL